MNKIKQYIKNLYFKWFPIKEETYIEKYKKLINPNRRMGNTTRQVDFIIQQLFDEFDNYVPIIDWAAFSYPSAQITQHLTEVLSNRLFREHRIKWYLDKSVKKGDVVFEFRGNSKYFSRWNPKYIALDMIIRDYNVNTSNLFIGRIFIKQ